MCVPNTFVSSQYSKNCLKYCYKYLIARYIDIATFYE